MAELVIGNRKTEVADGQWIRVCWDDNEARGIVRVEQRPPRNGSLRTGRTSPGAVTITRRLGLDPLFKEWAGQTLASRRPSGRPVRSRLVHDVTIEVVDRAGRTISRHLLKRGWASDYAALPALDAEGNEVGVEFIILENEGWAEDDHP